MWVSRILPGFEAGSVAHYTYGTAFKQCHASLIPIFDWEAREGDDLQRKLDDEIPPLCTLRSCPHQQQFLNRHTYTHGLSNDQDSRTAVMEDEISKVPGHCPAVMCDQNAALLRRERQYFRIRDLA